MIYVEKKHLLEIKMGNHIWNLTMLLLLLKVDQMQSIILLPSALIAIEEFMF